MLITDLRQPCQRCGSSGFEAGYDEYGSLHAKLRPVCIDCSGRGYVLTELGREVWSLLKPMILELVREEKVRYDESSKSEKDGKLPQGRD